MKKRLLFLVVVAVLVLCCGCTNAYGAEENILSKTDLSTREKNFLSLSASDYFVFDYSLSGYRSVDIWVERYEFGIKSEHSGSLNSGLGESGEGMLIASLDTSGETSRWTLCVSTDETSLRAAWIPSENSRNVSDYNKVSASNPNEIIVQEGSELVLGCVCYKSKLSGTISGIPNSFFDPPEAFYKDLSEYDIAYVLKCKLSK